MADKLYGIFADVKLTTVLQQGLNESRKFYLLEKALRTLVNMVPEPVLEEKTTLSYHLLHECNMYQPQEVLGGHPIIEFIFKFSDAVTKSEDKSPGRTQKTYLTTLYDPDYGTNE